MKIDNFTSVYFTELNNKKRYIKSFGLNNIDKYDATSKEVKSVSVLDKLTDKVSEVISKFKSIFKTKNEGCLNYFEVAKIHSQAQSFLKKTLKSLGIDKNYYPKLIINEPFTKYPAHYDVFENKITYSPEVYNKNSLDLNYDIIRSCLELQENLQIAGIPKDRICQIVKIELTDKIKNDDNFYFSLNRNEVVEQPKMPKQMQKDFIKFAQKSLYKKSDYLVNFFSDYCRGKTKLYKPNQLADIIDGCKDLIYKYPEFTLQYSDREEAFKELIYYSHSIMARYNAYIGIRDNIGKGSQIKIKKLTGEKLKKAETTFINRMNRMEMIKDYKYSFRTEDISNQDKFKNIVINNYYGEIDRLKQEDMLSDYDKKYIELQIQKIRAEQTFDEMSAYFDEQIKNYHNMLSPIYSENKVKASELDIRFIQIEVLSFYLSKIAEIEEKIKELTV